MVSHKTRIFNNREVCGLPLMQQQKQWLESSAALTDGPGLCVAHCCSLRQRQRQCSAVKCSAGGATHTMTEQHLNSKNVFLEVSWCVLADAEAVCHPVRVAAAVQGSLLPGSAAGFVCLLCLCRFYGGF